MKTWIAQKDGCSLVMQGGIWSIARYPAPNWPGPGVEFCLMWVDYQLFRKRTTATGERKIESMGVRTVRADDGPGRSRAVAELREIAER